MTKRKKKNERMRGKKTIREKKIVEDGENVPWRITLHSGMQIADMG